MILSASQKRKAISLFTPTVKEFYNSAEDINIAGGAIRSGKTHWQRLRFLEYIRNEAPQGCDLLITGKSKGTVERNIVIPLLAYLDPTKYTKKERPNYVIHYKPRNINIYVVGAKDEGAEELIRGGTFAGHLGDEMPLHPEGFVNHIIGRCSQDPGCKFWTNNPVPPTHWYYRRFVKPIREGKQKGTYSHFLLEDNPTLSDRYIDSIKSHYAGVYYDWFILGRYVAAAGLVYDQWDRKKHIISREIIEKYISNGFINRYYCALDWRFEYALAMVLIGVDKEDCCYIINEYKEIKQVVDHEWLKDTLKVFLRGRCDEVICDSSRPDQIQYCDDWSYKNKMKIDFMGAAKGPGSVNRGINEMNIALKRGKLLVSDRCTDWHTEIEGYSRKVDKDGNTKEEVNPVNDDLMDATRYGHDHFLTGGGSISVV